MTVTVTDYNNVDPNIFLYQRIAAVNDSEDDQDTFVGICSPVDLEDYPASAPASSSTDPAYFRMADIDIVVRSRTLMDNLWQQIVNDVDELVDTIAGICELGDPVVVEFGTLATSSSSSSSSSAAADESASSATCAADAYTSIEITASDDPEFPDGAVFTEVGVQSGPPDCARVWQLAGAVTPTLTMRVTTSIAMHTFVLELIESSVATEVDSGGLADGYKALFFYERDEGDYNLEVEGVT
jgi:hypothetical protein